MPEQSPIKRNIVRIIQEPMKDPDRRSGGAARKMFRGVRDRLAQLSVEFPYSVTEFEKNYPAEGPSLPYLVFELSPSAIAKSHSPSDILNNYGLRVIAGRKLEERIAHGKADDCRRFSDVLATAANVAPSDDQMRAWDDEERKAREEADRRSEESGRKIPQKRVRRSIRGPLPYHAIAQLSTIEEVRVLDPSEKVMTGPLSESEWPAPILIATYPFRRDIGDDLARWVGALEGAATDAGIDSLRVLRGSREGLESLKSATRSSRAKNLWNFEGARPFSPFGGTAFFILARVQDPHGIQRIAKLPFVQIVEPGRMEASSRKSVILPTVPKEHLPVAGLIDTGIANPSPIDPFILYRRGDDALRRRKLPHAVEIAELLVHNGDHLKRRPTSELPCGIIDVAGIDGIRTTEELLSAIGEATLEGKGAVNLSANIRNGRRFAPPPYVSAWGAMVDEESYSNDHLTVVNSAGNTGSLGMDPPADGVHVISVGAVERQADGSFVRPDYSCRGGGIAHNVKPTVVAPVERSGTSYAAPVATRLLANLGHRGFSREEAVALMVHHAAPPGKDPFHQPTLSEFEDFGFGMVPLLTDCDPPDRERFTMLYSVAAQKGLVHYLEFPMPPELVGQSAFVRLTAYTRSPVRADAGEEYVGAEAPTRLRLLYDKRKRITPHADLPPEPEDYPSRYEKHRIRYGWKWGVLRRYSKRIKLGDYRGFSLRIGPVVWREWVEREMVDQARKEGMDVKIRVQCALSFYPIEKDAPAFFDYFYAALLKANIALEIPAQAEIELES